MQCPHCNQEHPADSQFCPLTGKKIIREPITTPGASKTRARSPLSPWLIIGGGISGLLIVATIVVVMFIAFSKGTYISVAALPSMTPEMAQPSLTQETASPLMTTEAAPPPRTPEAFSDVWISKGPKNGGIHSLVIDPSTPNTIYAGTETGLFKSTDGGESWRAVSTGLGVVSVNLFL